MAKTMWGVTLRNKLRNEELRRRTNARISQEY